MRPEISRRCKACGASVRESANFCPNCGETLNLAMPGARAAIEIPETELKRLESELNVDPFASAAEAFEPPPDVTFKENPSSTDTTGKDGPRSKVVAYSSTRDKARPRKQSMTAAARDAVEDSLIPRMERLRQTSAVVLDEAADDPSLRFVLIAAVLFLIFLIMLLLSLAG